ncbi:PHD finger protein 10 [Bulinus truncatus]|nr:PHD finger protein 10 [Bulinus truncatus]
MASPTDRQSNIVLSEMEIHLDTTDELNIKEKDVECSEPCPPSQITEMESVVDTDVQEVSKHISVEGIQSVDSAFHLVNQLSTKVLDSSLDTVMEDHGQTSEVSVFTEEIVEDSAIQLCADLADSKEENELLTIEDSKKDALLDDIDEASERALLADDDTSNQLTRHLNEDMEISQISTDAKEVSDFNFLKPTCFTSLSLGTKDSSAIIANMEIDVDRELLIKDIVHPHIPEKVFDIDEETRMSSDQTPVDSSSIGASFIFPSLPPKKLFHIDDTKDSDLSDVETKMSTMTDTEDIRLIHTISVDDATKDSAASDSNAETPTIRKPRRASRESFGIVDGIDSAHRVLGAENVFEYQWPQDGGEWHLLQEQISEYLKVKSFKRKYPDLYRRICDKEEKDFLREKGVVTETQSDLGLTALRSEEVYDLMMKDYNEKYKEYIDHLQEKQKKVIREKHKEYSAAKLDKTKIEAYSKKAARSAAEFNASLMRDKKEDRRAYFDLQTFTVHFPKRKFQTVDPKLTKVGAYPVSLIPGQYQEYYKKYTSDELKYLPVKTVLFDPPKLAPYIRPPPAGVELVHPEKQTIKMNGSEGEDNDSSSTDDEDIEESVQNETMVSSKSIGTDDLDTPTVKVEKRIKSALKKKVSKFLMSPDRLKKYGKKPKDADGEKVNDVFILDGEDKEKKATSQMPAKIHGLEKCRICKKRSTKEERQNGRLVKCAQCGKIGHMSCLDLTEELVAVIRTYPWQCMECKTCIECLDPYDEDKMMFCDRCDRGYHTFCIGLDALPTGHWECKSCQCCPAVIANNEIKKLEQTTQLEIKSENGVKMEFIETPGQIHSVIGDLDNRINILVTTDQPETSHNVMVQDVQNQMSNVHVEIIPHFSGHVEVLPQASVVTAAPHISNTIADNTPVVKVERRGRKRKIVDPNADPKLPIKVQPVARPDADSRMKPVARQSKRLKIREEEEVERKKKEIEEKKMKRMKKKKQLAVVSSGHAIMLEEIKDVVSEGVDDSLAMMFERNEDDEMAGAVTDSVQPACLDTVTENMLGLSGVIIQTTGPADQSPFDHPVLVSGDVNSELLEMPTALPVHPADPGSTDKTEQLSSVMAYVSPSAVLELQPIDEPDVNMLTLSAEPASDIVTGPPLTVCEADVSVSKPHEDSPVCQPHVTTTSSLPPDLAVPESQHVGGGVVTQGEVINVMEVNAESSTQQPPDVMISGPSTETYESVDNDQSQVDLVN